MGAKSRGNWQVSKCLKKCKNRDILCEECVRCSNFKEKDGSHRVVHNSGSDSLNSN